MSLFESKEAASGEALLAVPMSEIDLALTAQFIVGWAGEGGEEQRLAWWRTDLVSEFGGEDLFRRLLPGTWRWATLQGAREAARRRDAELRRQDHDPDRIVSLFRFGYELDERISERLRELKSGDLSPEDALPGLAVTTADFRREAFLAWVEGHGRVEVTTSSVGRRLSGPLPATLGLAVSKLVAGLAPLGDSYPLPHIRRTK